MTSCSPNSLNMVRLRETIKVNPGKTYQQLSLLSGISDTTVISYLKKLHDWKEVSYEVCSNNTGHAIRRYYYGSSIEITLPAVPIDHMLCVLLGIGVTNESNC